MAAAFGPGLTVEAALLAHGPPDLVAVWVELRATPNLPLSQRLAGSWAKAEDQAAQAALERKRRDVLVLLWQNLLSLLAIGDLILTWQPPEPTEERRTLAADRCAELRLSRYWKRGRLHLGDYPLNGVRIHVAAEADQPPTTGGEELAPPAASNEIAIRQRGFTESDDKLAREVLTEMEAARSDNSSKLKHLTDWAWCKREGHRADGNGSEETKIKRLSAAIKRVRAQAARTTRSSENLSSPTKTE